MHKLQEVFINNADIHVCKGVQNVLKYKKISTVHFPTLRHNHSFQHMYRCSKPKIRTLTGLVCFDLRYVKRTIGFKAWEIRFLYLHWQFLLSGVFFFWNAYLRPSSDSYTPFPIYDIIKFTRKKTNVRVRSIFITLLSCCNLNLYHKVTLFMY